MKNRAHEPWVTEGLMYLNHPLRAEASERLSGEIIASLTAGLLVAGLDGHIRILNPAGRRMLDIPDDASSDECRRRLAGTPLMQVIE